MKLLIMITCILSFLFFVACGEDELTEEEPPITTVPGIIEKDDVEMVLIPAGEFEMGSDDGQSNEKPVHTVYVDAFYIDKYEVTVGEYKQFIKQTGHRSLPFLLLPDFVSRYSPTDKYPVVDVSWHDAMAYAIWKGKRLPTEAEWEKAARGGLVGKRYPWGDEPPDGSQCNFADKNAPADHSWADRNADDGYRYTAPVGSYPANGYGLYDMAGNVFEWCLDEYDSGFYIDSPRRNPVAGGKSLSDIVKLYQNINSKRVLRGGSSSDFGGVVRVALRVGHKPDSGLFIFGFRCVSPR